MLDKFQKLTQFYKEIFILKNAAEKTVSCVSLAVKQLKHETLSSSLRVLNHVLNAALAKSGALDFRWKKNIILFFAYEKGLGHMRKNGLVVVQISFSLFLRRHKPKIIFG